MWVSDIRPDKRGSFRVSYPPRPAHWMPGVLLLRPIKRPMRSAGCYRTTPLEGRFHEQTNHAGERQQPKKLDLRDLFNWSADLCCLVFSLNCRLIGHQNAYGAHVHSLSPIWRLDPVTNSSWSAAEFLLFRRPVEWAE